MKKLILPADSLAMFLKLATSLGWQDLRQSYRRSVVGPFWITAGMGVQILTMGLVFSIIFKTDLADYLPFLATSIIFWGLIAASINDACMTFISSESIIKQLNLPHHVYVVRVVWKNLLLAGHNIVILPLVLLWFSRLPDVTILSALPGLLILVLNLSWITLLLGMLSARFRDMPPIIASCTTIAFYLTPVMWYPTLIDDNSLAHLLLGLNPIYHWLQVVRQPFLGEWPTWENWGLALLSAGIGWLVTMSVYKKYRNMIAYWV
jgi:ABC-type polysaccharide/polyol phosphate export permease